MLDIGVPALLFLAAPTLLVIAAFLMLRTRPVWARRAIGFILIAVWLAAFGFWASYQQQDNDVGLMVHGIAAAGLSAAAFLASIAGLLMVRRL